MEFLYSGPGSSLPTRLGRWIGTSDARSPHRHWYWFLSGCGQFLFERVGDSFIRHLQLHPRSRNYHLQYAEINEIPDNISISRASVQVTRQYIRLLEVERDPGMNAHPIEAPGALHEELTPFASADLINSFETHLPTWVMQDLHFSPSLELLFIALISGKALFVSDGSFYPDTLQAGSAWVLSSPCCQSWITGGGCS